MRQGGVQWLAIVFGAVFWSGIALGARTLDMTDAISMGLQANEGVLAQRENVQGAEYGIRSARGAFGPSLSTGYEYTRYDEQRLSAGSEHDTFGATVSVTQPLFTGFRLLSSLEKAGIEKELAAARLDRTELDLILDIQQNFLDLLKARDDVRSARDSLARLESLLKVATAFYDVGLKPKLDVLQARVDVATAEQELLSARLAEQTGTARLNTLLNLGVGEEVRYVGELEFRPFSLSFKECFRRAMARRPDLRIAAKSVEAAGKDAALVAADFYPSVQAEWNYTRRGDTPFVNGAEFLEPSTWRAGVGMSWKVFEWGRTVNARRQADRNVSRLEAEYRDLVSNVAYEVKANHLQIREAEKRISVARKGVESARESYRMARARYQAQVGTYTDVLDAQAGQTRSEAALTRALAEYQGAVARLYASIGERNMDLVPE